jgi:hypothetical protein
MLIAAVSDFVLVRPFGLPAKAEWCKANLTHHGEHQPYHNGPKAGYPEASAGGSKAGN